MGRVVRSQRSYFCSVSFPRRLEQLLPGVVLIKFTSNVFSLLVVVTCIALFGHAVLGDPDTDLDGAPPVWSPSNPASSRRSGSFKDSGSPCMAMGSGKKSKALFCPGVTASKATGRRGAHLQLS